MYPKDLPFVRSAMNAPITYLTVRLHQCIIHFRKLISKSDVRAGGRSDAYGRHHRNVRFTNAWREIFVAFSK